MPRNLFRGSTAALASLTATLVSAAMLTAPPAVAAGRDSDSDGMPNRWETAHGLRAHVDDAARDLDKDGLRNLAEFRHSTLPESEDSDSDGSDDGDEVGDGDRSTDVDDEDSDDDGTEDGDEDSDADEVDNEDEDDAAETCLRDDDDRDDDNVSDEDENEQGTRVRDADSDGDGASDGDEDEDEDGEANEDEDDSDGDACDGDRDDDGEDDEDSDDLLGVIASYDGSIRQLTITAEAGGALTYQLSADTEIEWDSSGDGGSEDGSFADLQAGVQVAEVDLDDDTGAVEEIELIGAGADD